MAEPLGVVAAGHPRSAQAGAEAGQERLAREGSKHRRQGRVHCVPAVTQDVGAGLCGPRMAGGDYADRLGHRQNRLIYVE